ICSKVAPVNESDCSFAISISISVANIVLMIQSLFLMALRQVHRLSKRCVVYNSGWNCIRWARIFLYISTRPIQLKLIHEDSSSIMSFRVVSLT
ncbi:hypothetical protein GCK32_016132, partial [Trichostrongylus colubriformis]